MSRLLRILVLVGLVAGCAGPADPDPEVQERFRTAAAPLLSAHDLSLIHISEPTRPY